MTGRPMRSILLLTLALLTVAPGVAWADRRDKIIEDCADDSRLQGDYSDSELRDARRNLPADIAEYTDCEDVLRRAEQPERSGGDAATGGAAVPGGPSGAGGADAGGLLTPATASDQEALAEAGSSGGQPVTVGDQRIFPGAEGLSPEAARNGIPTTLAVVLVLLAAAAAAMLIPAVRRNWPARLKEMLPPLRRA